MPASAPPPVDPPAVATHVDELWRSSIEPTLVDSIRIPALSPAFDADWEANGHIHAAIDLARAWCEARAITGLQVEVVELPGRTPILLCEIPAFGGGRDRTGTAETDLPVDQQDTVVLYGHLDKQPPMHGWRDGLGPFEPVVERRRLYGRGGADDTYAVFAALAAIEGVQAAGGSHVRCIVVAECSEETGSPDLPAHIEALGARLGRVSFVVCLDSGAGDFDRVWFTTSLRGNLIARLRVDVLTEGVHSGDAGGIVPSSFRVLRRVLDRIEDPDTGRVLLPELHTTVPAARREELALTAAELGDDVAPFPFAGSTRPVLDDHAALLVAKAWEPSMSTTGVGGIPAMHEAGNVLRPHTEVMLSFRLPPGVDADAAGQALKRTAEAAPPHGASVRLDVESAEPGWDAPPTEPWLADAVDVASHATFGEPSRALGEGGTIPFMAMLGERFPAAQFLITGVLGPGANAHGPNEFLDLDMARRLTTAVALVLDAHAHRDR